MKLDNLSDEELMVMYQSGAEAAFRALYDRHSAKIYGFLKSRIWKDERASEYLQEVFLKMHRSRHLYNQTLPALPWIYSITKSVLNDGLRMERKLERDGEVSINDESPTNEHKFSEVTNLMNQLSTDQQSVLHLRYVSEKTFEEIALTLSTSPSNVRKILSRAVAKLKAIAKKGEMP